MSLKTERLQLKLNIDTAEGIRNVTKLQETVDLLNQKLKEAKGNEKSSIAKDALAAKEALDKERESLGLMGLTLKELRRYQRELNNEKSKYTEGTDQFAKADDDLNNIKNRIKDLSSNRQNTSESAVREQKFREIDDLRLMIKDSGEAALSLKQLEKVGQHLFDTMSSSAQSGAIETHQYYQEWLNINKAVKTGKEALDKQKTAENAYNATLKETIRTQGIEGTSLTHLKEYYKLLQEEIQNTSEFESEANKKRIADSQTTKSLIDKKEGEVKGTTSFFGQIKEQLPSAVAGAFGGMFVGLAGMAAEVIGGAFASGIDAVKKRARDITDIEVALNTTRANATKIKGDLNDIKTESSVDELKKLVVASGDLNVAENDIKAFVVEADKIGVVMGEDFGGSVEQAVTMIAKLKGEFKETRDMNFPDAIAKIGSTLKQLNLDGPASTQGITDFLKRVGAIPDAIKPTLPQLASFGAIFEEANLSAEISGSGFTKILTVAANNAALFGKQMGMTKKEIENLINTDPNQFVIKFAQSLKGLSGTDTAKSLKAVKLESDEVFKVVGILTDNIEKLTKSQVVSNKTFQDGTLTTQIFNKYLDDEAGKISQIGKAWSRVGASIVNVLAKVSGPAILWLADMTEKSKSVEETFTEQAKKTTRLETTLTPLVTKYTDLAKNSNLSATAQRELNQVIGDIGQIVPGAITGMDDLGRATKVNLGIVNDFLEKNRDLAKSTKNAAISQKNNINNALGGERSKLMKEINKGSYDDYSGFLAIKKETKLTEDDIIKRRDRIIDIGKTIAANQKRVKEYSTDVTVNSTTPPPKKDEPKTAGPVDQAALDKAKAAREKAQREAEARQKYMDESTKQMLELQAKLDFEELQATANAEEKRINIANKTAEDELKRIETQFKNQKGIVLKESQLSQEQKDIIHRERLQIERKQEEEVVAIYDEFDKKRQEQILEQSNRAIALAQEDNTKKLQAELKNAQRKGTSQDIFNAQEAILSNNQVVSLANLKVRYDKEKEVLKDNKKALEQLETNYGTEKSNIISQNLTEWELLISEFYKNDVERAKKANIEKLRLDVSEAELNGNNPNEAKIALLNAEMQAELSVANLTEAEKTNILRRYAQERQGIERDGLGKIIQEAIEAYSQAFAGITDIARTELNNRETAENEKFSSQKQRVEDLENAGTYSKAKAKFEQNKIEKAHNRELSKIKYEQAKLDKAANISQATINGIQAVMKAYAQTGILGGPIAAAIIGGITAVQIGQMIAQPLPKVEGSFFKGGAMPNMFENPLDEKGGGLILAHPDEFMIPKWIRQDPIFADIEPVVQHMIDTGRSHYNGGPVLETSKPSTMSTRPGQDITPILNRLADYLEQSLLMQEEVINGVKNIQLNVGYEAAEKILDAGNQLKTIKDSAKA